MESFVNKKIIEEERVTVCKADMIRYEVVYKYGGIYSDIDSLSVKPLGKTFLRSFVSITANRSPHYIQNCIFGFPAASNFLLNVLNSVQLHHNQITVRGVDGIPYKFGPIFFTSVFVSNVGNAWNFFINKSKFWLINDPLVKVAYNSNSIQIVDGFHLLHASGNSVVVQVMKY